MMNDTVSTAIEDSLNDFTSEISDTSTDTVDTTTDASTETTEAVDDTTEAVESVDSSKTDSMQVVAPTAQAEPTKATETDDFAKEFGLNPKGVTGAPNRIPYDRVKKIVTKAKADAKVAAIAEYEKEFQPKFKEYETKVTDYEDRLTKVAQFEHILENEPKQFLEMLSQIPIYKDFFDYIAQLAANKPTEEAKQPEKTALVPDVDPNDPRPLPNKVNPDGSRVYDLDGLDQLMAWQARQVEKKVSSQVEQQVSKRYAPIEEAWKRQEYLAKITPQIDQQVAEARTWDRFAELEPLVVELMNKDPRISLEKAYMVTYQKNIIPKLTSDRNKVRADVLAELKRQPIGTAAPVTRTQTKQVSDNTPRSIEAIIEAELAKIS